MLRLLEDSGIESQLHLGGSRMTLHHMLPLRRIIKLFLVRSGADSGWIQQNIRTH